MAPLTFNQPKFQHTATPKVPRAQASSYDNIKMLEFQNKRNVYFISFDSLIPKSLYRKHFQSESTAYHKIIDDNFSIFENHFADRIATAYSLNSLLSFDLDHFEQAFEDNQPAHFFPGHRPSPLLDIFKYNGYQVTTMYRSASLGGSKGPHVDRYIIGNKQTGACQHINRRSWYIFFGYCTISDFIFKNNFNQSDVMIDAWNENLETGLPQFFLGYIYSPGHTEPPFKKEDVENTQRYKTEYISNSRETAKHIEKILDFVKLKDPSALIYIFGDHGPYLSRQFQFEEDKQFFVQDRFGTLGAVYPQEACTDSFNKQYHEEFVTTLQVAHMLIRCFGGENAFVNRPNFEVLPKFNGTFPHSGRYPAAGETFHYFRDYTYE